MSVTTQWIEITSADGTFGAYLAIPPTPVKVRGLC